MRTVGGASSGRSISLMLSTRRAGIGLAILLGSLLAAHIASDNRRPGYLTR